VIVKGSCEPNPWYLNQFGCPIDSNWVVLQMDVANTFNTISCKAMFQKLQVPRGQLFQLFPFIHFLCLLFSLFFNHHFSLGDLFVILLSVNMCQIDLFVKPFFSLAHFHVLHYYSSIFPSCLFFYSLVDDTHIFDLAYIVPFLSLSFYFPIGLCWIGHFNLASAQFGSLLVCLLGSPS